MSSHGREKAEVLTPIINHCLLVSSNATRSRKVGWHPCLNPSSEEPGGSALVRVPRPSAAQRSPPQSEGNRAAGGVLCPRGTSCPPRARGKHRQCRSQFALNKKVLDPHSVISGESPSEVDLFQSGRLLAARRGLRAPAGPGAAERNRPFHEARSLCK